MWIYRLRRRYVALATFFVFGLFVLSLSIFSLQGEINEAFGVQDYGHKLLARFNFKLMEESANEYGEDDIVDDSEDDYYYDYDNVNPNFKEGDFDVVQLNSTNLTQQRASHRYNVERKLQGQLGNARNLRNYGGQSELKTWNTDRIIRVVEDNIFWSTDVEALAPKGFSDKEVENLSKSFRSKRVVSVRPPSWDHCGRPKNQFVTLSDGSHMCARYRHPHDYLIQGEVMSFHLARTLGICNVPVVVLSRIDRSASQWTRTEIQKNLTAAGWARNGTIALIQWIENLERDKMPAIVLNALLTRSNVSRRTLSNANLTRVQLIELLQWSDLVVFDYITGNYDRVASMQDAAERESNPTILNDTVHNLVKSTKTGSLWLIDNESGLVDAYYLLYSGSQSEHQRDRFVSFHRRMLSTFCVFRRSLYRRITVLSRLANPAKVLQGEAEKMEPLIKLLPDLSKDKVFCQRFRERIISVYDRMKECNGNKAEA